MSDRRTGLRADALAGLTTAAVVVPQAMAYAAIAGLPVQLGLYAALVPMAVHALLGTSRPIDRELVALGAANVTGSVFAAVPAAGGLSQIAVNDRAGARSHASS